MKLLTVGLALIAFVPGFAQDQTTRHNYQIFRIRDGFRVVVDNERVLEATAKSVEDVKPLPVVRFKGNVEITIDGVELQADEVDYHWDTGELEPYGNVHLKPVAPPNQ